MLKKDVQKTKAASALAQARLAFYRRAARDELENSRGQRPQRPFLEPGPRSTRLFVSWDEDRETLMDLIDMASDWGPFELIDLQRASVDPDSGSPRFEGRFAYHGPEAARAHHEVELLGALQRFARWAPAPE